jgi:hypothetical protein
MTVLLLKRASASRTSGKWDENDFDVLADGAVVGRILKVHAAPVGTPWMWTLAFWQRWPSRLVATASEDRLSVPTHTSFAAAPIAEQSDL